MKNLILSAIIILMGNSIAFSQNDDDPILIQNFYQVCKSEKYSAFNAVSKGIQLFDTKQYSRSMKSFQKALDIDPDYCDTYYLMAYCHQKKGEYEKAIEYCNKSLSMNSENPSALIIMANTYYKIEDIDKAIELFEKAIGYLPTNIDAYYGLALMYQLKGENQLSTEVLNHMEEKGAKTKNVREKKKIKTLKEKVKI